MTHIYQALTGSLVPNASVNGQLIPSQSRLLSHNSKSMCSPCVLFWATKLFSLHHKSLTPMFQAFHLKGLTTPFLFRPTHINYISLYVLNRESFIRRCPKYELTTHSSTLMMDDHTHVPTPNMLTSLCICNASVTAIYHVTMMHTTLTIPMQHISQAYKHPSIHD